MSVRFLAFFATALTLSAAAVAEPSRPARHEASQPSGHSNEVVLASADQVQAPTPSPDQATATPVKHRAARVTTCRCGDQIQQPDE